MYFIALNSYYQNDLVDLKLKDLHKTVHVGKPNHPQGYKVTVLYCSLQRAGAIQYLCTLLTGTITNGKLPLKGRNLLRRYANNSILKSKLNFLPRATRAIIKYRVVLTTLMIKRFLKTFTLG